MLGRTAIRVGMPNMQPIRKWVKSPGILLTLAAAIVLLICLMAFGASHQDANSQTILSLPILWFAGLIVLPFVLFVLLGWVWRRFDRISR